MHVAGNHEPSFLVADCLTKAQGVTQVLVFGNDVFGNIVFASPSKR
jgi:hypothetical protein